MKLKIAFRGDYAREFGGDKPRLWITYQVIEDNKVIGMIEQEPSDYNYPFRTYKSDCVIGGNYIGHFKTKKEAMKILSL